MARTRFPRRRKDVHYGEGDWFAVPLPSGRYAVGRIVRRGEDDGAEEGDILAYFFGPRREREPALADVTDLKPASAITSSRCSPYGLTRFNWVLLGQADDYAANPWPMPIFAFYDLFTLRPLLSVPKPDGSFEEDQHLRIPCDADDALGRPISGLVNHWGMEDYLDRLLAEAELE
jgi:hypothetical protein